MLQDRLKESLEGEVDRRKFIQGAGAVAAGAGLAGTSGASPGHGDAGGQDPEHGLFGVEGDYQQASFDPHEFLYEFNTGDSGQENVNKNVYKEDGRTVRHFELNAVGTNIEIAPGIEFPSWAYEGQVPGPTLRAVEGDLIRVTFKNLQKHAHTIHPHLRNLNPTMDGIPSNGPGVIDQGDSFTYEWIAQPAGMHFYHCHSLPLAAHIHRGLYGTIVVDPDPERVKKKPREYVNYHGPMTKEYRNRLVEIAKTRNHTYPENDEYNEMVMTMNGFDTNFDHENEVYAANTQAFAYGVDTDGKGNWSSKKGIKPIKIDGDKPQRIYLLNVIEFDPINSFHSHSQFFDYYSHGTTLEPTKFNVDTVMQCQAQRGIIELDYSDHQPGLYMFHAHQSEFAELGWMSFFEVT
ncbi:MAG: multicopper oxidase domain-containing protein [Halobacteria archaeon]